MSQISGSLLVKAAIWSWRRVCSFCRGTLRLRVFGRRANAGALSKPVLGFCPYLPLSKTIAFADWEIGPIRNFEGRWSDQAFESRAKAFLAKFVDGSGRQLPNPAIICRRGRPIDGATPTRHEVEAIEVALGFALLDENVRRTEATANRTWDLITADNTDPFFWPVDVVSGHVAVRTGAMITVLAGGYTIDDPELVIRAPLDLYVPMGTDLSDGACADAVYSVALRSLQGPGQNVDDDKLVTAIRWFIKAWRNTATVDFSDRVVMLKTAFETLTGSSKSHVSASRLRGLFETMSTIATAGDADQLVWSPAEVPRHTRTWTNQAGIPQTTQLTDLEHWFMSFADIRNQIIHEGSSPSLIHTGTSAHYDGPVVFTAEYLLRAAIKVRLHAMGWPDLWRTPISRALRAAYHAVVGRA